MTITVITTVIKSSAVFLKQKYLKMYKLLFSTYIKKTYLLKVLLMIRYDTYIKVELMYFIRPWMYVTKQAKCKRNECSSAHPINPTNLKSIRRLVDSVLKSFYYSNRIPMLLPPLSTLLCKLICDWICEHITVIVTRINCPIKKKQTKLIVNCHFHIKSNKKKNIFIWIICNM